MNRHIPFDRLHNFRDLGGYTAEDGRSVRWARLIDIRPTSPGPLHFRLISLHRPPPVRRAPSGRILEEAAATPHRAATSHARA
ncbi:tyrosine-protein phosphatase [Streptomyces sp. NPDC005393]|uniref:tyrosine-protein phosphatase n=1 Tax=Streptomyces sp. NPDC005393 TaxID=3157041 RepID=UPI0033A09733